MNNIGDKILFTRTSKMATEPSWKTWSQLNLFARTEANCLSMLGHVAARLPFDLRNRPVACLRTFSRRKRGILVAGNFKTCHDHDHDWEIITIERRVNCPWLIDLLLFGASDERIYLKDRVFILCCVRSWELTLQRYSESKVFTRVNSWIILDL